MAFTSSFTICLSFVWVAICEILRMVLAGCIWVLIIILLFCFHNLGCPYFFLIAFSFIIVWVSIHLSWAQDRPAFGTGNGKWCKIFLYTTSNTVLLRWSGLGWLGFGSWDAVLLRSVPYELHEVGTDTLCLLVFFRTIGILISSLNWYILLISPSICLVPKKPHAVLKISNIAPCFMLSVHIPDEIHAQHLSRSCTSTNNSDDVLRFRIRFEALVWR
ncbi:hypothetical protein BGX38DRAFT_72769 [Terfezia claveryi]|nr:hypothetical protein BGX38DRAFT_72769 [Terfezia claveryi]